MSPYRLQDPQVRHLVGQEDARLHVELVKAPPRASVQQVKEQRDPVLMQDSHVTEKAIKLQIWKAVSSQALSAQICEQ